ncbi:hypothetical protein AB0C12_27715 [Actinoplanes sp. NPDC048967]|uniref:hypothetical protein n=1 Tax=Actinoplanes sp. NPDC048967 TaxID=3155269 RepID=UPI0033DE3ACF
MTTFRLLRQTARSARFARVGVEVTPADTASVEVIVDVDEHHRREAELGARWALRDQPARVTVTEVFTTEIDTGTGDVHEATARAVVQALGDDRSVPYAGFSDQRMISAWLTSRVGLRLDAATEARRSSGLDAWLLLAGDLPVGLHGRGDELRLVRDDPFPSDGLGDGVLSGLVGERLNAGAVIPAPGGEPFCAGLVLRFGDDDLVIGPQGLRAGVQPALSHLEWISS